MEAIWSSHLAHCDFLKSTFHRQFFVPARVWSFRIYQKYAFGLYSWVYILHIAIADMLLLSESVNSLQATFIAKIRSVPDFYVFRGWMLDNFAWFHYVSEIKTNKSQYGIGSVYSECEGYWKSLGKNFISKEMGKKGGLNILYWRFFNFFFLNHSVK